MKITNRLSAIYKYFDELQQRVQIRSHDNQQQHKSTEQRLRFSFNNSNQLKRIQHHLEVRQRLTRVCI